MIFKNGNVARLSEIGLKKPMRTRIPCAAENRIRLWQKIRRHSDSFGAVEVNIGQPIGGFAHKNADVLGNPLKKRGASSWVIRRVGYPGRTGTFVLNETGVGAQSRPM